MSATHDPRACRDRPRKEPAMGLTYAAIEDAVHPEQVETDEYIAFVRRIMRALARRVGSADVETLAEMVKLRDELDDEIARAIAGLRDDPAAPASWGEIGRALEISRQAAQKRWRNTGGRRRPGGQPGYLR